MRLLTPQEKHQLKILTKHSISFTLIEPTATGLKKSILDATGPVRNYLKSNNFHDYELQGKGPSNKIFLNGIIYRKFTTHKSRVSLYRPVTKKGDPRIWFYGLTKYALPNDILVLICFNNKIHVLNLTQLPIRNLINFSKTSPLKELVFEINGIANAIANELLFKLRNLAKLGPIPSLVNADTSVGRTLEDALGIPMNSSKKPDYKGIELKSFRSKRNNRKTLFAKVPNWKLSKFKSSDEILNNFGYLNPNKVFKLYCTVSTKSPNPQGLQLQINSDLNHLIEKSSKPEIGNFALWLLEDLHKRLSTKHKETFWISADSIPINGKEHFLYTKVEHTKKPIISQFDILLDQGAITLDHLIKQLPSGGVSEKGPLFKIAPNALSLLFPPSSTYSLV